MVVAKRDRTGCLWALERGLGMDWMGADVVAASEWWVTPPPTSPCLLSLPLRPTVHHLSTSYPHVIHNPKARL